MLAKAYLTESDIAKMLHAFETLNKDIRSTPFFEYVRSKANIADLPSRGEFEYITEVLGASFVETILPSLHGWAAGPQQRSARKHSRKSRNV